MSDERGYVFRTIRSTLIVAVLVVLILAAYRQNGLIAPFAVGVALASVLLWGLNFFVRGIFAPIKPQPKKRDKRGALLAFALVKYPLVALLIWALVRAWGHDTARMMAFVGGFILLQIIIALRAIGKAVSKG